MVINTTKGYFEVLKNVREALNIETFQTKYLEEYFDQYQYIVGDIASDTIRLKGFTMDSSKTNYYKYIPDYLCESCAYRGAYFILRRINEDEYRKLVEKYKVSPNLDIDKSEEKGFTIEKTPFDKDQLVLESNAGDTPHIKFDMARINAVKTFPMPEDLKEDKNNNYRKDNRNKDKFNQNNTNNKDSNKKNVNTNNNNNSNNKPVNTGNNNNSNNKPKENKTSQSFNNAEKKNFSSNPNRKAFSNNKK